MEYSHITHPFDPIYDRNSRILILGSFPSVKSWEQQFFYGHPMNRFWKVMAGVFEKAVPVTVEEKKQFLLENGIAVWDVIESCDIKGSSDSSIRNVVPTDIAGVLKESHIKKIYTNGKTAGTLFTKYQEKAIGRPAVILPSTSPANAAYSLERLIQIWKEELDFS